MEPTVSVLGLRAVAFGAAARGLPIDELCKRFDVDPKLLEDVDGRVAARTMIPIWNEVPSIIGDVDFGLHLGEELAAHGPALLFHLVRASRTLGEGLLRLHASWRVLNDVHPAEFRDDGSRGVLAMRTNHTPMPSPRHATEMTFAWIVEVSRRVTGANVAPESLAFEHAAPESTREHERIFGCPVTFDAPETKLVFDKNVLALPTATYDPELVAILDRHLQALDRKLPAPGGEMIRRVRAEAMKLLPTGDATIDRVAQVLGQSARSLQRKLGGEGTTFQSVLDDVKRDLASEYLRERTHSIAEIALLLGFSDQSTFHRAFVRWTGRTPGDVRRG
jgi:AraC-like DNA-binding protein